MQTGACEYECVGGGAMAETEIIETSGGLG